MVAASTDMMAPPGQTAPRKYIDYKQIEKEKEGLAEGTVEFIAPSKPGPYFARCQRTRFVIPCHPAGL